MAEFRGQVVTNKGRNLLSRALAGEGKIIFTKAAFGDQKHNGSLREVEELKNKKLDLVVMNIRNDNGTAILTVQISNEHVEESFRTEEFGVYAKIEGDQSDILYSYTVAEEADYFPSNKLGKTFESIHEVYMAISSDTEAEIYVRDGIIFLTRDIANQNYTENGLIAVGPLKGRSNLEENKSYADELGHWYKNIGGNRTWNGSGNPDENLIPLTWQTLFELIQNKSQKDKVQLKAIVGNTFNPTYIQDAGQKIQGQFYIDRPTGRMFKCIQTTSTTNNNVTYFQDYSIDKTVERLENLHTFQMKVIENENVKITFFHDQDDRICYGSIFVKKQFRINTDRIVCKNTLNRKFDGVIVTTFKGSGSSYFFRGFFLQIEEGYIYADTGDFTVFTS